MATSVIGGETRTVTTIQPPTTNTTTLYAGQGPAGRNGSDGESDKHYTFDQMSASAEWKIVHGLGKYPSVVITDSGGSAVDGEVIYDSLNQVTVRFSGAFAGIAYLN